MSKLLQQIRDAYDAAQAAAEDDGAAPEGVSSLPAARELTGTPVPWWESAVLREASEAAQRVVDEAAPPRAA